MTKLEYKKYLQSEWWRLRRLERMHVGRWSFGKIACDCCRLPLNPRDRLERANGERAFADAMANVMGVDDELELWDAAWFEVKVKAQDELMRMAR